MSLGKHNRNSESILLPALPALQNFENSKQDAIFRMLGVSEEVHEEVEQLYKRLGIGKKTYRGEGKTMLWIRTFWKKILAIDTQLCREKALATLKRMIRYSLERSLDPKLKDNKQRMQWIRTLGYLFQAWNSIANSYDTFQVKTELEKLNKRITDELEQRGRAPQKPS